MDKRGAGLEKRGYKALSQKPRLPVEREGHILRFRAKRFDYIMNQILSWLFAAVLSFLFPVSVSQHLKSEIVIQ
jgi:hypothetical protein